MKKALIIFGSSRSDGHTMKGVRVLMENRPTELIDLSKKIISYYDYKHTNREDDFLAIARKMTQADHIIFATPIYWYAMSAPMKTFFDRLSDLLTIHKNLGRALVGKQTYLLACGAEKELPEGFEVPFRRTSEYFGMEYRGCVYWQTGEKKASTEGEIQGKIENLADLFC